MHHPIPVWGGADPPGFGVADAELAVGPGPVGEAAQLLLQPQQFGAQLGVEGDPRRPWRCRRGWRCNTGMNQRTRSRAAS